MKPLYNSVLPSKIYGVLHGDKQVATIQAADVNEAMDLAKAHKKCKGLTIAVIRKTKTKTRAERRQEAGRGDFYAKTS